MILLRCTVTFWRSAVVLERRCKLLSFYNNKELSITRWCRHQCCCLENAVAGGIDDYVWQTYKNVDRKPGNIARAYTETVISQTVWRTAPRPVYAACSCI